jgi:ribosomal protein S18 acetylase RimI-like enzyme
VGKALIDAVRSWAATQKVHELRLMVTSVNPGATRFYERLGFRKTGRTEPYPNDPAIFEYEMVLELNA